MEKFSYVLKTGMVNAMGNSEIASDGFEFESKEELINHLEKMDFDFTTDPEAFKNSARKAYEELQEEGNTDNSTAYNGGYWTESAGYDSEYSGYEADSDRNAVLVVIDRVYE